MTDDQPKATNRPDWATLRAKFISGSMNLVELAEQDGVNYSATKQRAKREKWTEARTSASLKLSAEVAEKMLAGKVDDLVTFNENDLKVAKALRAQIAGHITRAQKNNVMLTPAEIRTLASTAESIQRIGRLALGASTTNNELTGKDGKEFDFPLVRVNFIKTKPKDG